MVLNLVKLCVGIESVEHYEEVVSSRIDLAQKNREKIDLKHTTRMVPRRDHELVDGGSLYWVIKGSIQIRQLIRDIEPFTDPEGIGRCHIKLDTVLVRTFPMPRRAFQGWRYLKPDDSPNDLSKVSSRQTIPQQLLRELAELGLL
ncbi:MAG: DUF1489 domain-containing protein [Cohaesibacteraceae bacterium]|nr:DUF1489 domain-containing protein [Cohaesibacteraceae bacterium]MBL4876602.1 DUF1489 domain-containing protein [Cohaesibacteraceae bacterium]